MWSCLANVTTKIIQNRGLSRQGERWSNQAVADDHSAAILGSLYQVGAEFFRTAVIMGRLDDTQLWVKRKFEGVELIRQAAGV